MTLIKNPLRFNGEILTFNSAPVSSDIIYTDASGGVITYVGDYAYHTFESSANFVVLNPITIDFLLVGSGGAGSPGDLYGEFPGGGGGGGFVLEKFNTSISPDTYFVKVGSVINGPDDPEAALTSFYNDDASGGRGYGNYSASSSARGFAGGINSNGGTPVGAMGGGGGDSGDGDNATGDSGGGNGGNGGIGTLSTITGSYYGGGGGGGCTAGYVAGNGTHGGGKGGVGNQNGTDASVNTGGGGGGAGRYGKKLQGKGGSGIVVIKYKYK